MRALGHELGGPAKAEQMIRGQGISLILAGAFSRLLKDHPEKAAEYGGAAALFVFVYTFVFGATWLTIPWVYPTETFPLEVRAKGNAFGVVGWSIGESCGGVLSCLALQQGRILRTHILTARRQETAG